MSSVCFLMGTLYSTIIKYKPVFTIISTISIFIVLVIVIYFWYKASIIDPTDHIQLIHKKCMKDSISFNFRKYKFFCKTCKTSVSNNAYHCKKCNRCV